jgi:hypothetical protein
MGSDCIGYPCPRCSERAALAEPNNKSDKLRESLKLFREWTAKQEDRTAFVFHDEELTKVVNALVRIANAYVDENDDDERLADEAWLRHIGFTECRPVNLADQDWVSLEKGPLWWRTRFVTTSKDGKTKTATYSLCIAPLSGINSMWADPTRGDIRRVMKALRME